MASEASAAGVAAHATGTSRGLDGVRVIRGERCSAAHFAGMSWPIPMAELEHRLRYGESVCREDALAAARVLSAYVQMILDPAVKRRRVVGALRYAIRKLAPRTNTAPNRGGDAASRREGPATSLLKADAFHSTSGTKGNG